MGEVGLCCISFPGQILLGCNYSFCHRVISLFLSPLEVTVPSLQLSVGLLFKEERTLCISLNEKSHAIVIMMSDELRDLLDQAVAVAHVFSFELWICAPCWLLEPSALQLFSKLAFSLSSNLVRGSFT